MWKITLPDHVLEKLRCSLCNEYLSQLPVYIYPDNAGRGCGRCPVLSDQSPIRDATYEVIAEYLTFPCRYKSYGCIENVLAINMHSHEESCSYKQYFCPFIPLASCPWQGPASELFAHYEEHHKLLALHDSTFEIDLINMYEDNYLFSHHDGCFIIQVKCDIKDKLFWCAVRYVGNKKMAQKFLFQLELKKLNGSETIKLPTKQVECDNDMNIDKSTAVHIDSEDIKKSLDFPCSIICYINIIPNETYLRNSLNTSKTSTTVISDDVDEDILRELECPICNEYMVPPIHQCVAGHSICGVCRTQVSQCPTCRDNIQATRNFSLEKMTRLIKYCCKYRDFDCPFVSSSDQIRQHESNCQYGPHNCPFIGYNHCKWKGKGSDIMTHARIEHEDNVLDVEYITWPFDDDQLDEYDNDCYIINVHEKIFKVIFEYKEQTFYWSVQLIGPAEDAVNYMFELDVCDNSESYQRFFIKKNCSILTAHEEAFDEENTFVKIPLSLLKPLMVNNNLFYKCRIVQKE